MTLVDTNVLIDIVVDSAWADWSQQQLDRIAVAGNLYINDVIFAELSVRFANVADVRAFLSEAEIVHAPIPHEALFLAGKAFVQYRRAVGRRTGVLPDFFIGAHAAVARLPLLTRDARRYRRYFPTIEVIAPDFGPDFGSDLA